MTDKVKTLGVWLSTDPEIMLKANYEEKIITLKASLGCWELRRLRLSLWMNSLIRVNNKPIHYFHGLIKP